MLSGGRKGLRAARVTPDPVALCAAGRNRDLEWDREKRLTHGRLWGGRIYAGGLPLCHIRVRPAMENVQPYLPEKCQCPEFLFHIEG